MPTPGPAVIAATTPEALHAALEDAFGRGDLDAYAALHAPDATLVVPPSGDIARGIDAIRAAAAPFIALRPRLRSTVIGKIEGAGVALTHARWQLTAVGSAGKPVEQRGRGTVVSRRTPADTWQIAIDNPLTPE